MGYVTNALSGRLGHLNSTSTRFSFECKNRLQDIQSPYNIILLNLLNGVQYLFFTQLLEKRGVERIIKVNIKEISYEQFRQLYCVVLSFFAEIFCALNPSYKKDLGKNLRNILDEPEMSERIFSTFDSIGINRNFKRQIDMMPIALQLWAEVVDVLKQGDKKDIKASFLFVNTCLSIYSVVLDTIKKELNLYSLKGLQEEKTEEKNILKEQAVEDALEEERVEQWNSAKVQTSKGITGELGVNKSFFQKQNIIVLIAISIFIGTALYPPWRSDLTGRSIGEHFIITPPKYSHIDFELLLRSWGKIAIAAVLLIYYSSKK